MRFGAIEIIPDVDRTRELQKDIAARNAQYQTTHPESFAGCDCGHCAYLGRIAPNGLPAEMLSLLDQLGLRYDACSEAYTLTDAPHGLWEGCWLGVGKVVDEGLDGVDRPGHRISEHVSISIEAEPSPLHLSGYKGLDSRANLYGVNVLFDLRATDPSSGQCM